MRTLSRAVRTLDKGGSALPIPFTTLTAQHISIRRGEVHMIAAAPGVGKSAIALTIAMQSKVPTLYVSADTTEATMAIRALAALTGQAQDIVEEQLSADPVGAAALLREHTSHIRWMFDPSPTLNDLQDELSAYRMLQGEDPTLLIIDNAGDITFDAGDEFASLRALMREMKWFSRDTNAAVVVLHHTSESFQGTQDHPCPPRSYIHGKVSQVPAVILTLGVPTPGFIAVAAVKNRYGKADISGKTSIWLEFEGATMSVRDWYSQ